jgi:hypothetical protein
MVSPSSGSDEPDRIVKAAFATAAAIAAEQAEDAEADQIHRGNSLRLADDLLGGVDLAGHLDAEAGATLKAAVEAAADQPHRPDDDPPVDAEGHPVPTSWLPPTGRSAQLAEGLYRVALAYLASTGAIDPADLPDRAQAHTHATGGGGAPRWMRPGRAHPRVSLVVDHNGLEGLQTARMLLGLAGGPLPVTRLTIDRLTCDAAIGVVITQDGRPVAAGDHTSPVTTRQRDVLHAVDRACRFPGCRAPAQWTDAHHIVPRKAGGPTHTDNLTLLCRACHTRVHERGWALTMDPRTREVTVSKGTYRFTSLPP